MSRTDVVLSTSSVPVFLSESLKKSFFSLCCMGVMAYFGYHALQGDNGLLAWHALQSESDSLTAELEAITAVRQSMEAKVSLMRPESLDPDMIDERARETLNLSHRNEIVILRKAR